MEPESEPPADNKAFNLDDGRGILWIVCHPVISIQARAKRHQRQKRKPSTPKKVLTISLSCLSHRNFEQDRQDKIASFPLKPVDRLRDGFGTLDAR